MSFQVIAGSGHCGTMWLARVLNSVPGQVWHHELRSELTGLPWQEADRWAPNDPAFDRYWGHIQAEAERYPVGDSNSWPPEALPYIHQRVMEIERVIYLTRDKERQLHSILHHSPVWANPPYPGVARDRLRLYRMISGRLESVRILVEANDFMPDWLRELAPLTDAELVSWQKRDINRKVVA